MTNTPSTKRSLLLAGAAAVAIWASMSTPALAAGIGDLAREWKTQIESMIDVLGIISLLAGIGFGISGALMFQKWSESNGQIELRQPIMRIVIGIILVALPLTLGVGIGTLFGTKGGAITSSGSQTGLGSITPK